MRAIRKFQLPKRGNVIIEMPAGTELLQAQSQGQDVFLYGIVDLEARGTQKRDIRVMVTDFAELPAPNTGDPEGVLDDYRYLGTVARAGEYIVHVFEFFAAEPEAKEPEIKK